MCQCRHGQWGHVSLPPHASGGDLARHPTALSMGGFLSAEFGRVPHLHVARSPLVLLSCQPSSDIPVLSSWWPVIWTAELRLHIWFMNPRKYGYSNHNWSLRSKLQLHIFPRPAPFGWEDWSPMLRLGSAMDSAKERAEGPTFHTESVEVSCSQRWGLLHVVTWVVPSLETLPENFRFLS